MTTTRTPDQHCPIQLSAIMEMSHPCAIPLSSHKSLSAIECLKSDYETEELNFYFIYLILFYIVTYVKWLHSVECPSRESAFLITPWSTLNEMFSVTTSSPSHNMKVALGTSEHILHLSLTNATSGSFQCIQIIPNLILSFKVFRISYALQVTCTLPKHVCYIFTGDS